MSGREEIERFKNDAEGVPEEVEDLVTVRSRFIPAMLSRTQSPR